MSIILYYVFVLYSFILKILSFFSCFEHFNFKQFLSKSSFSMILYLWRSYILIRLFFFKIRNYKWIERNPNELLYLYINIGSLTNEYCIIEKEKIVWNSVSLTSGFTRPLMGDRKKHVFIGSVVDWWWFWPVFDSIMTVLMTV